MHLAVLTWTRTVIVFYKPGQFTNIVISLQKINYILTIISYYAGLKFIISDWNLFGKSEILAGLTPINLHELNDKSIAQVFPNYLANYFLTPRAALTWQWKYERELFKKMYVLYKQLIN